VKKSLGNKTFVFPTPTWLIGTYDAAGKPNIMAAAWGGVCCSSPASVGVSLRKATYSYGAIIARKAFTVSIPSKKYVREADFAGIASGRDVNKFDISGLTPVKGEFVDAPYVGEFPLVLECRLSHTIEIGLHTQFIGEILDVKAEESILGENEKPDAALVKTFSYDPGSRKYYATGRAIAEAFIIGKELVPEALLKDKP
jgi:flavin reductase (DIM6/NTAB) family NADH-FMN oxidoreductase RutF